MRHRKSGNRLSRAADHRKALMRNLVTSLVLQGRLTTTAAKAKALKAYFEKVATRVRSSDDNNAIRFLSGVMFSEAASKKCLQFVRSCKNESGIIRSARVGLRDGDRAEMMLVEIASPAPKA